MPCSDGGYGRDDYDRIQSRADAATRAACEAITLLQGTPLFPQLSVETRAWWNRHQREDQERIAREQAEEQRRKAKQDALDKLSPGERRLLGIY